MDKSSNRLIARAAEIVSAYVINNPVQVSALPIILGAVYETLSKLGDDCSSIKPMAKLTPAEIRASIRHDAIISFEDGQPYKALRRHFTMRGISPGDYRAKWGLPADYPLVSAAYSARRSEISRAIGRGRMRASVRLEAAE
jgi:predicted transcriptional regulator